MLRQGEEIDKLRDQVATLQKQLDDRTIKQRQMGTMAEAALELTNIFEEADKAVKIYLDNIRRRINGE
ncbi:MAG: DNA repair protein [Clostridiales bacterium]|nr:DNA repair protein [Clostridiales bacterium]